MTLDDLRRAVRLWRKEPTVHRDALLALVGDDIRPVLSLFGVTEEDRLLRSQALWDKAGEDRAAVLSNTLEKYDEKIKTEKKALLPKLAEALETALPSGVFTAELLALAHATHASESLCVAGYCVRAGIVRDLLHSLRRRPHTVALVENALVVQWSGASRGTIRLLLTAVVA